MHIWWNSIYLQRVKYELSKSKEIHLKKSSQALLLEVVIGAILRVLFDLNAP